MNIKRLVLSLITILSCIQASAEYVPTKIYAYGFASSFNDSTVYFTKVMELDSAWVEKKNRFLYSRDNYSAQLKEYMIQQGVQNPTCIISFALTQKDAEKKYQKLRSKYIKDGKNYTIVTLSEGVFNFEVISAADDYAATHKETKEERKQRKLEAKAAKQKAKATIKEKKQKAKAVKAEQKAKRKASKAKKK